MFLGDWKPLSTRSTSELPMARVQRLLIGIALLLILVGLVLVLLAHNTILLDAALLLIAGFVILLAMAIYQFIRSKFIAVVAALIIVVLVFIYAVPVLLGPAPAPAPCQTGCATAQIGFGVPAARTSNLMVSADGKSVNITNTGTVVFDMTISNLGDTDSAVNLYFTFTNSRDSEVWNSTNGASSTGGAQVIKNITINYMTYGIVGAELKAPFQLLSHQSQQFRFTLETSYPVAWPMLPASEIGVFTVVGAPSDSLIVNGAPTPPQG